MRKELTEDVRSIATCSLMSLFFLRQVRFCCTRFYHEFDVHAMCPMAKKEKQLTRRIKKKK